MTSAGGYTFTKFASDVTVNRDATLDVVETIDGEFLLPRHGIYRNIPVRYQAADGSHFSLPIDVRSVTRDGAPEPYAASRQGDEEVIQIGDPNRAISGPFAYQIHYRVARAILFEPNDDQVYWNATGMDWGVPIPDARATVHVEGVAQKDFQARCFTGAQGSTASDCALTAQDGSVTATAHDFLTIAVRFPKGIVAPPSAWQRFAWWLQEYWDALFWFVPLVALAWLIRRFFRLRKGLKGRGVIIPLYDPPDGLRPTEVGALVDEKADRRDLSAAIIDLAVRGYVRIVEKDGRTLGVFASRAYTLEKRKEADGLKPYEALIFNSLFAGGPSKTLAQTDQAMATALGAASDRVVQDLTAAGYFAANPKRTQAAFVSAALFVGIAGWFVGHWVGDATGNASSLEALLATAGLLLVAAPFMRARSEKGVLAREQALGFKLFLSTAERYRLQWQEREGIFEQFLPYAMVFGVADKWAKVFEGMNLPQPDWYVGPFVGAYAVTSLASSLDGFANFASAVHAPSARGGGGFGGGGFSGGGFGGGGGGSW